MQNPTNAQTVRQLYENFVVGNIGAVLDVLAEDIDWESRVNWPGGPIPPYAGKCSGRNDVAECFRLFRETVQYEKAMASTKYTAVGDYVLVTGQDIRRDLSTGQFTENRWSMFWTFKEGKVVRLRIYQDTVEPLEKV